MREISNLQDLEELAKQSTAILIYFYNDNCAPCLALRPKVGTMVNADFPKMNLVFVNAGKNPVLASSFGVFASPTILTYFEGRETFRVSKYISTEELRERINRYYDLLFG